MNRAVLEHRSAIYVICVMWRMYICIIYLYAGLTV